jgi:archaellum component FlaD/FlaE
VGGAAPASAQPAAAAMPPAPAAPSTDDFTALLGGGDTSELDNKVKALEDKTQKLESAVRETLELTKSNKSRLDSIDTNMKKFLSLYELVTNQINPFVDSNKPFKQQDLLEMKMPEPEEEEKKPVMPPAKKEKAIKPEPKEEKIMMPLAEDLEVEMPKEEVAAPLSTFEHEKPSLSEKTKRQTNELSDKEQVMFMQSVKDGNASFVMEWITSLVNEDGTMEKNTKLLQYLLNLGWITPKAYEALMQHMQALAQAGKMSPQNPQRIPLMVGVQGGGIPPMGSTTGKPMQIPPMPFGPIGNGDSLLTILEWVKYLVDKVGYTEATDILKYLVQLEWITPEAHEALLKYIEKSTPQGALTSPIFQKGQIPPSLRTQAKAVFPPSGIPTPDDFIRSEYRVQIQGQDGRAPQPQIWKEQYYPTPQYRPIQSPSPQERRKQQVNAIIPLTELGSDIDSLAIILEWIRYLVDRAGTQGTKDIFGYYQNIGWIEKPVLQQLTKYVDGIKSQDEETTDYQPTVEDHATSLFFISKLKRMELSEEDINSMLRK